MERKPLSPDEFTKITKNYKKEEIKISKHYIDKINTEKRDISPEIIKEYLLSKKPNIVEIQLNEEEKRYKSIYKMSSKYDLITVVAEKQPKSLKVITSYKSSKRIKKLWQKKAKLAMKK